MAVVTDRLQFHSLCWFWVPRSAAEDKPQGQWIRTTAGRVLFNSFIPPGMPFENRTLGKGQLGDLVFRCFTEVGLLPATRFLDDLKDFGFRYATLGGISVGISDLEIPLEKTHILAEADDMVALVDRYIFSIIARARVRGVPARWLNDVFEFAAVPDLVLYLDVDVDHLLPRVLAVRQLDHWESGEDFLRGPDLHDNFIRYQTALLEEFRNLAEEHNFVTIDARGSVGDVFEALQTEVRAALNGMGEQ